MSDQHRAAETKRRGKMPSRQQKQPTPLEPEMAEVQLAQDLATIQRVLADPGRPRPDTILALQRTVGNDAVGRLIETRRMTSSLSHAHMPAGDIQAKPAADIQRDPDPPPLARLLAGAAQDDRGGMTKAGRALQKHSSRLGSVWPQPTGKRDAAAYNRLGQTLVEQILNDPTTTSSESQRARYGLVYEYTAADGRGLRFDAQGDLIGFLEP